MAAINYSPMAAVTPLSGRFDFNPFAPHFAE